LNIAVNTRLLLKGKLEGIGWYTFETFRRITISHPEHQFFFIFDRPYDNSFIFSDNVYPIIAKPKARHPFLFYWWFEKVIPKILKKIKADIFISPDGYLSLKTDVKSLAVIHDINFMHYPKDFPFLIRKYYHHFFPRFAQRAKRIVTVSEFSRHDISKTFGIHPDKIGLSYNGANSIYKPISNQEKEEIKKNITTGNDYFLFVGALSPRKNVARLLCAFEQFRNKTQSAIKLVIVGEKMFKTHDIKNAYRQSKFKNDIIFTGRLLPEELRKFYAASLALVFVPYFEGFGIPIAEAMYCETAVITANVTSMPEVAGDAALYADPFSVDSIADAMYKMYSDPELRTSLIEKGKIQKNLFSWDKTAEDLWKNIEKVMYE